MRDFDAGFRAPARGRARRHRAAHRARLFRDRLRRDAGRAPCPVRGRHRDDRPRDGSARSLSLQGAADAQGVRRFPHHAAAPAPDARHEPSARSIPRTGKRRAQVSTPRSIAASTGCATSASSRYGGKRRHRVKDALARPLPASGASLDALVETFRTRSSSLRHRQPASALLRLGAWRRHRRRRARRDAGGLHEQQRRRTRPCRGLCRAPGDRVVQGALRFSRKRERPADDRHLDGERSSRWRWRATPKPGPTCSATASARHRAPRLLCLDAKRMARPRRRARFWGWARRRCASCRSTPISACRCRRLRR